MDRASILGDAVEYLKELLQKIGDLHNELESTTPAGSSLTSSFLHPLTPKLPTSMQEELCLSSLPSPNGQPVRVMYCLPFSGTSFFFFPYIYASTHMPFLISVPIFGYEYHICDDKKNKIK